MGFSFPLPPALDVQPGLNAQQQADRMALEKWMADLRAQVDRYIADLQLREQEARLAGNPSDFVAYELFKRRLEGEGRKPVTGGSRTNFDIGRAAESAWGTNAMNPLTMYESERSPGVIGSPAGWDKVFVDPRFGGGFDGKGGEHPGPGLGRGQFDVRIPRTQEFSRQNWMNMSESEKALLGSFLKGGVTEGNNQFTQIDPGEYFKELEQGLIPTGDFGRTQYKMG